MDGARRPVVVDCVKVSQPEQRALFDRKLERVLADGWSVGAPHRRPSVQIAYELIVVVVVVVVVVYQVAVRLVEVVERQRPG